MASAAVAYGKDDIGPLDTSPTTVTQPLEPMPDPSSAPTKRPLHTLESATEDSMSTHSRDSAGASLSAPQGLNLPAIFGRRGSLMPTRRPNTGGSVASNSSAGARQQSLPDHSAQGEADIEMTAVRNTGKQKAVTEAERKRNEDVKKQDEAMAKWRKWIVEQPTASPQLPQAVNGSPGRGAPDSPVRSRTPSLAGVTPMTPMTPASARNGDVPPDAIDVSPTADARGSGSDTSPYTYSVRNSAGSGLGGGVVASSSMDIYLTDSVRALRDVELAVDPEYLAKAAAAVAAGDDGGLGRARARRLSTHPRLSDQPNPFVDIDTILSRRGIRPLVLELLHALGAYVDAVWCTRYPGKPCPWRRVRGASDAPANANPSGPGPVGLGVSTTSSWRSWVIASVQEGKRLGLLSDPPTHRDVAFWEDEVRYGLRDVDEAVNRRKDLGWAFAQAVVKGRYGDIYKTNVLVGDGEAGNIARLLNDLEEAIWGDAIPAPTDLAYEVELDFNPFSVYREGDLLIGVDANYNAIASRSNGGTSSSTPISTSPLSRFFGDDALTPPSIAGVSKAGVGTTAVGSTQHPLANGDAKRERSRDRDRRTASLDLSAFGDLRSMSKDEMLAMGRQRHREWAASVQLQQGDFDPIPEM